MTAEVQSVLQEARDVLAIAAAALIGGGRAGGYSVQVVDAAGQVGEHPVEVGLNNKISVEVRDGLRAGERVVTGMADGGAPARAEEHTSELQSLMRISYAVFCLNKKKLPTGGHPIAHT